MWEEKIVKNNSKQKNVKGVPHIEIWGVKKDLFQVWWKDDALRAYLSHKRVLN